MHLRSVLVLVVVVLGSCGGDSAPSDGGGIDAPGTDGGHDAASADGGPTDAATPIDATTPTDAFAGDAACATPDGDGDGHASIACGGDDCDDTDATAYPTATEVCDSGGHDEDCNPATLGPDGDSDGYPSTGCCDHQSDGSTLCGTDCDDTSADVSPVAPEVCDGVDDNCNGSVDEGVSQHFYRDCDGDGYGDAMDSGTTGCVASEFMACFGHPRVTSNSDCDDTQATINPAATEACDLAMVDENCNGSHNEGCTCVTGTSVPCGSSLPGCSMGTQTCTGGGYGMCSVTNTIGTCYTDADNDTFAPAAATTSMACTCPAGTTATQPTGSANTDCNDTTAAAHPGATEICDGIDNNCNGSTDEGVGSTYYRDADGDGYGNGAMPVLGCSMPGGTAANNLDCDDTNAAVHPGAVETCNCIDDNCVGGVDEGLTTVRYRDADMDGHGAAGTPLTLCTASLTTCSGGSGAGYVVSSDDCDDGDGRAYPGHTACYGTSRPGGSFDFNCDGASTPCISQGTTCPGRFANCGTIVNWSAGVAPPCGVSAPGVTCYSGALSYCYLDTVTASYQEQCN